jgi:hypothetical protein
LPTAKRARIALLALTLATRHARHVRPIEAIGAREQTLPSAPGDRREVPAAHKAGTNRCESKVSLLANSTSQ